MEYETEAMWRVQNSGNVESTKLWQCGEYETQAMWGVRK